MYRLPSGHTPMLREPEIAGLLLASPGADAFRKKAAPAAQGGKRELTAPHPSHASLVIGGGGV